jgi:hypothetical protein
MAVQVDDLIATCKVLADVRVDRVTDRSAILAKIRSEANTNYAAELFCEPFMQMLFLPVEASFELVPMSEEEAAEREMRSRRIHASRDTLGKDSAWTSSTNTVFDGTYRRILGAARSQAKKEGA